MEVSHQHCGFVGCQKGPFDCVLELTKRPALWMEEEDLRKNAEARWPPPRAPEQIWNPWAGSEALDDHELLGHVSNHGTQLRCNESRVLLANDTLQHSVIPGRSTSNAFSDSLFEKAADAVNGDLDGHALDGCSMPDCRSDGVHDGAELAGPHPVNNLPSFEDHAPVNDSSPPDANSAPSLAHVQPSHQIPQCPDRWFPTSGRSAMDYVFLDGPLMTTSISSAGHGIWSPQEQTAVLDDPLMQPLPHIHGNKSTIIAPHMAKSLSASAGSECQSPRLSPCQHNSNGSYLPFDAHLEGGTRHNADHHGAGQAIAGSTCPVRDPSRKPPLASQPSQGYLMASVHKNRYITGRDGIVSTDGGVLSRNCQDMSTEAMPGVHILPRQYGNTWMRSTNVSEQVDVGLSCSAPSVPSASCITSNTDGLGGHLDGFQPTSAPVNQSASLLHFWQGHPPHSQRLPVNKEQSLQILHSTLCNVGSAHERTSKRRQSGALL